MIRAIGPTLSSFGVSGVLLRPQLELFDSSGKSLAVAVPWSTTSTDTMLELKKAAADVGVFALREGSEDQVLLVVLQPGSYTCVVSGLNGATGIVLLEGYEVSSLEGGFG
jgi:hypothetical protein